MKFHLAKRIARAGSRRIDSAWIVVGCAILALAGFSMIGCVDPLVHLHTFGDMALEAERRAGALEGLI